uniref:Uncharacterized protein n=1 Tax=Knipowitschia caucasica TaxID=637954 RepID=A0AAV2LNV8_KNICA
MKRATQAESSGQSNCPQLSTSRDSSTTSGVSAVGDEAQADPLSAAASDPYLSLFYRQLHTAVSRMATVRARRH